MDSEWLSSTVLFDLTETRKFYTIISRKALENRKCTRTETLACKFRRKWRFHFASQLFIHVSSDTSAGIKIKLIEYCNEQYNIDRNSNLQIILEFSFNKIFSTVLFDIEETRPNFALFDIFGPIEHLKPHDRSSSLQN